MIRLFNKKGSDELLRLSKKYKNQKIQFIVDSEVIVSFFLTEFISDGKIYLSTERSISKEKPLFKLKKLLCFISTTPIKSEIKIVEKYKISQ